jgi:hypothetical protein
MCSLLESCFHAGQWPSEHRNYYLTEKDIANAQGKLDTLEWKFANDQAERLKAVRLHVQRIPAKTNHYPPHSR